ncbi:MAG TPA: tyrosine decarboxylase MfnA [Methanothermobacter sp.]|mgnify:FL=1|nr:L-tyrosine decarboxylase [Methanothermobacter sp. MT-2]HHW04564.1 tyrosine decarboxylase MfnA [Methanothermobacter sp.]HOK72028.1 tyrosine decarboxylase MfnA [Methanothermobacter sp.]HOL68341.1 tyrosine decarboxylase MfnA [Methanothermobacter sp.]HPQ04099.1 tyrosine decarboxylase MfnA [Methanothermobacter sp.]
MNFKGLPKAKVLDLVRKFREEDLTYTSGRILSSMCTSPHPIAKEVYCEFLESNLGDPGLFKGTRALEKEVIRMLGELLGNPNVKGHVVTGGTEANLMGMRAARNMKNVKRPGIIVPKSAHFSFKKAAEILGLELKEAVLDGNYRVDVDSVGELISSGTVAVVGIAGTTELGVVDPIPELSRLCREEGIHLHVDAALGGFIIPFLKEAGYDIPDFDFRLEGVSSVTVDPHKMGLAPIPSGCILFRGRDYLDSMSVETPYLTEKQQSTIVGTRSGASAAATWAIMKYMGREGYMRTVEDSMRVTRFLARELERCGFELVVEPQLNIVAFNSPDMSPEALARELELKGWSVSISSYPRAVRIVLMPHIKMEHIEAFLDDLSGI